MKYSLILLILASIALTHGEAAQYDAMSVTLYINLGPTPLFEYLSNSVCPFSHKSHILDVGFIPGWGAQEREGQVWCPDGVNTCTLNKVAVCLKKLHPIPPYVQDALCCLAGQPEGTEIYTCLGMDEQQERELNDCMTSPDTTKKLLSYAEEARNIAPEYKKDVMIMVNGIFDATISDRLREGFQSEICHLLTPAAYGELILD